MPVPVRCTYAPTRSRASVQRRLLARGRDVRDSRTCRHRLLGPATATAQSWNPLEPSRAVAQVGLE